MQRVSLEARVPDSNLRAHRNDRKSHKYLSLIPNSVYLQTTPVSSECQKCPWLPDWTESVIEGSSECREIAIIIAVRVLSEKLWKRMAMWTTCQGLCRALDGAFVSEGGSLSFIGFIINMPLMAVCLDKWFGWENGPTNKKRLLVLRGERRRPQGS